MKTFFAVKIALLHLCQQNKANMTQDSGHIIGFSGTYYCLWSFHNEGRYAINNANQWVQTGTETKFRYIKRISTDLDKVRKMYPNIAIDMNLCGTKWVGEVPVKKAEVFPSTHFPSELRKWAGKDIRECEDASALWVMYLHENPEWARQKAYARRRLIDLGVLVKFDGWKPAKNNKYCTLDYISRQAAKKAYQSVQKGHHFENGKRIELNVRVIRQSGFETQYGYCFVVELASEDGRHFKYVGSSSPFDAEQQDSQMYCIRATVKHDTYKGEAETKLQRIVVNKPELIN